MWTIIKVKSPSQGKLSGNNNGGPDRFVNIELDMDLLGIPILKIQPPGLMQKKVRESYLIWWVMAKRKLKIYFKMEIVSLFINKFSK